MAKVGPNLGEFDRSRPFRASDGPTHEGASDVVGLEDPEGAARGEVRGVVAEELRARRAAIVAWAGGAARAAANTCKPRRCCGNLRVGTLAALTPEAFESNLRLRVQPDVYAETWTNLGQLQAIIGSKLVGQKAKL